MPSSAAVPMPSVKPGWLLMRDLALFLCFLRFLLLLLVELRRSSRSSSLISDSELDCCGCCSAVPWNPAWTLPEKACAGCPVSPCCSSCVNHVGMTAGMAVLAGGCWVAVAAMGGCCCGTVAAGSCCCCA